MDKMNRAEILAALAAVDQTLAAIKRALLPDANDPLLSEWIEACCVADPAGYMKASEAFKSYRSFGGRLGPKTFSNALAGFPGVYRKRVATGSRLVGLSLRRDPA